MSGFYENIAGDGFEAPVETKFANRADTTKPYTNQSQAEFRAKAANAPTSAQEDKSYCSWWRFFTKQIAGNAFEAAVYANFNRADVTAENYDRYRADYIAYYKQQLQG